MTPTLSPTSKYTMLLTFHFLLLIALAVGAGSNPLSRNLLIVNDSGESLAVDWIHPQTGETVSYWKGDKDQHVTVDSFVNHTFLVRPINASSESTCVPPTADDDDDDGDKTIQPQGDCLSYPTITVSEEPSEQIFHVKQGLQVVKEMPTKLIGEKASLQASDIVFNCKLDADVALYKKQPMEQVYTALTSCLEKRTAQVLVEKNEELAFESNLRKTLASVAEDYTCSDPSRQTSQPVRERTWTHQGVPRKVGILHERPASQIHIIRDFISEDECQAVEKEAKSTLHRGTVADGKGGSRLSENRKAWQAGIKIDWDKEAEGDLIAAVDRRLFDYTNDVMGYNMQVDGQEDLMSIQYFGNGTNDPTPDRYMPHCDGDCDGLPHKMGGRVATVVMYCDVPELGGGTNFQQANVFVKPTKRAAAFFAYMDPVTMLKDTGFTTHSGCPVLEGTKRIAVQWMRVGVDAENPWDSFDTNTVSIKSSTDTYTSV